MPLFCSCPDMLALSRFFGLAWVTGLSLSQLPLSTGCEGAEDKWVGIPFPAPRFFLHPSSLALCPEGVSFPGGITRAPFLAGFP